MEISVSNPSYDDYSDDYQTTAPSSGAQTFGFRETRVMKSWGASESKEYIVGPPHFMNGRVVRMITCMLTSREMSMIEENDSGGSATSESGSETYIFVTENGERLVMRVENAENAPDSSQDTPESAVKEAETPISSRLPFDTGSKGLYGRN